MDEEPESEELGATTTHKRMSYLGLLRSFRPSSEEELSELAQQLGQAERKKDKKKEVTEKELASKQKAHRKWRRKLNWTPQRALEREGSSQDGLSSTLTLTLTLTLILTLALTLTLTLTP